MLDRQRPQLVRALQRLDRLGTVAVRLIRRSKANTVADLEHLQPVLTELNKTGNELGASLERVTSFPFPRNSLNTIKGDFAGMYGQASLDIDAINKLLASLATGQTSDGPLGELPEVLSKADLTEAARREQADRCGPGHLPAALAHPRRPAEGAVMLTPRIRRPARRLRRPARLDDRPTGCSTTSTPARSSARRSR